MQPLGKINPRKLTKDFISLRKIFFFSYLLKLASVQLVTRVHLYINFPKGIIQTEWH